MDEQIQVVLGFRGGQRLSSWRSEQLVQGGKRISGGALNMDIIEHIESKRLE